LEIYRKIYALFIKVPPCILDLLGNEMH